MFAPDFLDYKHGWIKIVMDRNLVEEKGFDVWCAQAKHRNGWGNGLKFDGFCVHQHHGRNPLGLSRHKQKSPLLGLENEKVYMVEPWLGWDESALKSIFSSNRRSLPALKLFLHSLRYIIAIKWLHPSLNELSRFTRDTSFYISVLSISFLNLGHLDFKLQPNAIPGFASFYIKTYPQ